jgi:hypothetical protein
MHRTVSTFYINITVTLGITVKCADATALLEQGDRVQGLMPEHGYG